ncbi:DNA/RNA non-specific endonuclease [Companilactobacillus crustorum]|uniref:DNA/RNA non-specific endonuclease n=1 Tax=Companilactobacillus crustorum TaxID=392416 RepID=UPI000ECD2739|nr:DNA/RNA non-specific endonuclease [Companilactobacillus crustorum]WDT65551.1 DNA/RNA non-specific endonuclease [Companilactobacillus crustorum]HCD08298.1 hydroxyacid dehydrogenase [Lactobacillus sp.]
MKKLLKTLVVLTVLPAVMASAVQVQASSKSNVKTEYVKDYSYQKKTKKLVTKNKNLKKSITKLQKKIADDQKFIDEHNNKSNQNSSNTDLANLDYNGTQEIIVNDNKPNFSNDDLSTAKGAWQQYGDLDKLNRVTAANAMLNVSLMPSAKREPLHWNPTGWHNKKISGGWLYNRSHLIGYQLTGQNNNPKNLMTGTRSLNSPEMLAHEMDIAYYLKQSNSHYIRYRVTPIFRGDELLPRGVQMEAQSIGDNSVHFNVYIFNVQSGVTLNYADGTSQIG